MSILTSGEKWVGRWTLLALLGLSACTGASGKNGQNGSDGVNGRNGANGGASLVDLVPEPSGAHCPSGGTRIDSGIDLNGNGALDANEVTGSTYVCAGAAGTNGDAGLPGATGADGGPGAAGHTTLVRTSRENAGANCPYGGVRIEAGLDANGDGVLEDNEVNAGQTQFLCDPPGIGACTASGVLPIAGDYTAADGSERWLRQTATAISFTIVPAGAAVSSSPPQLFRVKLICPQWLLLQSPSGAVARLDWATTAGALSICVRPTTDVSAASIMTVPGADATTGCAAGPWTALTKETP